jgi:hypothetical protein
VALAVFREMEENLQFAENFLQARGRDLQKKLQAERDERARSRSSSRS